MRFTDKIVQEDMVSIYAQKTIWNDLKEKTILVTGASGMLATYLVFFIMYLNHSLDYRIKVIALVRNEEKAWGKFGDFRMNKYFRLLVQDVCSPMDINERIDYIVHLAGNASPQFILNDPVGIVKANTLGTINIMELARRSNTIRVVYASTREVYGKVEENISEIRENCFGNLDPMERRACYPESKRMAESILQSYYYQYGIESVVVRIAHSYGPGMQIENDGRVMADFISDIVHNRNIVLKSSGDAIRAFCYVSDAVAGILIAMLNGVAGEAYNIANENEPKPIRQVAEILVSLFPEKELKVVFDIPEEMSQGYSKMGRVKLCTRKIEDIGWRCLMPLSEGMRRTVLSF